MKKEKHEDNKDIIIGRNPVIEAIKAGRTIKKIFISSKEKKGIITEIIKLAKQKDIIIQEVNSDYLNRLSYNNVHQGIIALTVPFSYVEIEDILKKTKDKNENAFIILADGITDPHNLGAIIRTAEALGVHGLVIPKRNSAQINSIVSKTSAGAIEYLPVAKETNMVRCIKFLKKEGLWIIGADMDGDINIYDTNLEVPIALVIGGEDKGLGRLIKENCDYITKIPMKGKISSLNASVAGAMLMYEVARQRRNW